MINDSPKYDLIDLKMPKKTNENQTEHDWIVSALNRKLKREKRLKWLLNDEDLI